MQTTQDPQIIDNSNNTVKISAPPPSSISTVSQNLQKKVQFFRKASPDMSQLYAIMLRGGEIGAFIYYRGSPHRTEKWETENTVLCEIRLMRGLRIFQVHTCKMGISSLLNCSSILEFAWLSSRNTNPKFKN